MVLGGFEEIPQTTRLAAQPSLPTPIDTKTDAVTKESAVSLPCGSDPRLQELHRRPITDTSITPPVRRQERALECLRKGVAARIFLIKPTASQDLVFARISSCIVMAFSVARLRRAFISSCAKYSSTAWRKNSLRLRLSFAAIRSIVLSSFLSNEMLIRVNCSSHSHSMVLGGFEEMS